LHLITGYTTRRHLLLDLDNTTLSKALRVVKLIMSDWPEVGSCLILQSSEKALKTSTRHSWNGWPWIKTEASNYHLVFNNHIGLNKCCRIAETLAVLRILQKDYEKIRTFRGDMTLRVSEVETIGGVKPAPVAVCAVLGEKGYGDGEGIREYLNLRRCSRGILPL